MILLVHAHPGPDSFTASIAREIARRLESAGTDTRVVDLYRIPIPAALHPGSPSRTIGSITPFPPLLDADELHRKTSLDSIVQAQMNLVENASGYVVVHPDWWGGPPAILKGWIDRVLRPGTAYEIPEGYGHRDAEGLLAGRKALVVVTGDARDAGPLEDFWINHVWGFCGVNAHLRYFPRIRESNLKSREAFIKECFSDATDLFSPTQTS